MIGKPDGPITYRVSKGADVFPSIGGILCRLGWHRWRALKFFDARLPHSGGAIFGLACSRCARRRLTAGGARIAAPPMPGSKGEAAGRARRRRARKWAAEGLSCDPGVIPIHWR